MSVRRHEQQTRISDSGHGVLDIWLPFCGAGGFETHGGGILVVVEGDAAIAGVSGPQRGVPPGNVSLSVWSKPRSLACPTSLGLQLHFSTPRSDVLPDAIGPRR